MRKIFILQALFFILLLQSQAQSAFFTSDSPRCVNDTMHFTPGSPGGVIIQESWDFGDGTVTTYLPPALFPVFATHVYASPGTFNVTRIVKFSGGNVQYSIQVQVIPLPLANFSFSGTACAGQVIQFVDLSLTNWGTIQSWSWNFGDPSSGFNNTSTLSNPSHIFSAGGTYTVTLTVTNSNGCSDTHSALITIHALPVAEFSFPATNCTGSPVAFTDLSYIAPGFPSYIIQWVWDFGDGTPLVAISFPNNPNVMHTFIGSATAHTVRLTVTTSNGCTGFKEKTVTSTPAPVANFTQAGSTCEFQPVQFIDLSQTNGGGTIQSWTWNFGDPASGVNNTAATQNPVHIFAGPGTYLVCLVIANINGCTDTICKAVSVSTIPVANFTFSGVTCAGQSVQFVDLSQTNGGGSIQSWSWNFGDPPSGTNNTSTLQNPSHIFSALGTYTVTLTVTNSNGCSATHSALVTINDLPVANFSNTNACEGSPIQFTNLSIPNAAVIVSFNWNFGDGGTSSLFSPAHTFASYGIYYVTLTVVNSNGCSHSVMKPVTVNPKPVAEFSFPATNCIGSPVQFTDLSYIASGFSSYIVQWVWDFGDGTPLVSISFPNNPNVIHTFFGSAMAHVVRLTVTTSNGCAGFKERTVTSTPAPVANFTQAGSTCEFQPVQFIDLSQTNGGGTIQSWTWNFGDPASGVNNTAATQNPVHIFAGPGTYLVYLVIVNSNGCTDTISKFLAVNSLPVAHFTADTVLQGTATTFTDLSYSATGVIVSRLWEFGDGQTSSTINPSHLYGTSGIFAAKLTVTDNNGCSKDTTRPVVVLFNPVIGPPATRTVTNVIVANGETKCYNASQVITVAGNGTLFFVLSGGSATFIAGQKILFLPSTTIQPGGYMHGYIAPTGPWCVTPSMPAVVMDAEAVRPDEIPVIMEESGFKIFPNPTTGEFTLDLPGEIPAGNVSAELYGILGEKMLTTTLNGESRHEFSLSGKPAGVYFIRVISGNKSEILKVLKN